MSVTSCSPEPRAQGAAPLLLIEEITHRVINEYTTAILSIDSEAAHRCCQSNGNASPVWRTDPNPRRDLAHDGPPLGQGG
ncbi:MAG: hypothetical protein JWO83_1990 [Caulobacteraceae bacterium]|jgi:hypothetical protein|nr:hypothetical protein [Caulobacteraceae bacterium]